MELTIYNQIDSRYSFFVEVFEALKNDVSEEYLYSIIFEYKNIDWVNISCEIIQFVNGFPDQKKKLLKTLEDRYKDLLTIITKEFPTCWENIAIRDTLGKYEDPKLELLCKLIIDLTKIYEHITTFEGATQEQTEPPHKSDKLQPIEKILILYYLNFNTLEKYQLGLKPGVHFLSKFLDINPTSIKNPLSKLADYTTADKLTESQARNLYPVLEKVKLFFDESDLSKISKTIEKRIKQLKSISGKE